MGRGADEFFWRSHARRDFEIARLANSERGRHRVVNQVKNN